MEYGGYCEIEEHVRVAMGVREKEVFGRDASR